MKNPQEIRNIAIVAHIDHGKTTLLDSLLKASNIFRENELIPECVMDSYDQERERGITIFAKHTSIYYKDYKINIIDTPGHADFAGEVERILGMVDSVLLLVDAKEGPMPQTRFVLSKALKKGLNPIVVVNKVDKPHANPDLALDKTFDLFVELSATNEQLDFDYCYASGLSGFAVRDLGEPREGMAPLFELIIESVPPPKAILEGPFLMQVATLGYSDYLGRQATGYIQRGSVAKGQNLTCVDRDGACTNFSVTKIEGYEGLKKIEMPQAFAGDIVSISGIDSITIGDVLCDPKAIERLDPIEIEEPTVSIDISINNSPFAGKEGKYVTFNKIKERLLREKKANISLKIEDSSVYSDAITVSGRGELHLAVLIEAMRREGYELAILQPRVVTKIVEGVKHEPFEQVYIEVPEEHSGKVIEALSKRRGQLQHLSTNEHNICQIEFLMPTRGLIGLRNDFLTMTKGLGILSSSFSEFMPYQGEINKRENGSLISMNQGKATGYSCFNLQERGQLFVSPGEEVYEKLVVGLHNRDNDLVVNITKAKQLTNFRAAQSDENVILTPAKKMNLEEAIGFVKEDEMIEVTPKTIRIKKL